jgi:hypothetical protein
MMGGDDVDLSSVPQDLLGSQDQRDPNSRLDQAQPPLDPFYSMIHVVEPQLVAA